MSKKDILPLNHLPMDLLLFRFFNSEHILLYAFIALPSMKNMCQIDGKLVQKHSKWWYGIDSKKSNFMCTLFDADLRSVYIF